MIVFRRLVPFIAWLPLTLWAQGVNPASTPIFDQEDEGQKMAQRLRALAPEESSQERGVIEIIGRNGKPRRIPFTFQIRVTSTNWLADYRAAGPKAEEAELLTIIHIPGRTNTYLRVLGNSTNQPSLTQPFAGSDFWVQDLGLEFIHWPEQRALRAEMSRSRPCRVLESVNPAAPTSSYSRVLSWVDNESGGVLQAEAYDSSGKLLKKFTVGKVEKVNGRWRLMDIRMRNARTEQTTELKFQSPPDASR